MMPPCLRLPSSTLNPAALLLLCAVASACVNLVDRPDIRPLVYTHPPDLESEFTHSTIEAEVHRPHGSPPHRGEEPGRAFRHAAPLIPSPVMSPRPPAPPWHPDHSTAAPASSASSVDTVISSLFTLLWKGYHLYQKGTPVPAILTYLWPTLSMLISSLFE
ncbi:hypothetical protein GWK47_005046 [Chionoecetes opilio]|uniref:Uncharacterized protein n=1 Tax=Chionoecetes opilio TaxID=41210 RepID=A0A8J4YJG3_CHIOP|nr:hypothetical protein GWK47_005046 [Chionoecetes opilio]